MLIIYIVITAIFLYIVLTDKEKLGEIPTWFLIIMAVVWPLTLSYSIYLELDKMRKKRCAVKEADDFEENPFNE